MNRVTEWKKFWQEKSAESISDSEYDRGNAPRGREIEHLSTEELLKFIAPKTEEVIFDAGCGTGVNLVRLHSKVKRLIGMDYTDGAIERCKGRICSSGIKNVELMQGSITDIPLPDRSVDKVLCMSVLQYLDDSQVRAAFKEFTRIMTGEGNLILHVKNLSSLYLSTLRVAKRVKMLFRRRVRLEYVRPFRWYVKELTKSGFEIIDYNSFNLFMLESMPRRLLLFLQRFELRNHDTSFFRSGFIRRHGSDLKIKVKLAKRT